MSKIYNVIVVIISLFIFLTGCDRLTADEESKTESVIDNSLNLTSTSASFYENLPENCTYGTDGIIVCNGTDILKKDILGSYSGEFDINQLFLDRYNIPSVKDVESVECEIRHVYKYRCVANENEQYYVVFVESYNEFPALVFTYKVLAEGYDDVIESIVKSADVTQW